MIQAASQQPLPTLHTLCPQRTTERFEKALKVRTCMAISFCVVG